MSSHPLSVLVVDDDPDGAESLAQLLRLSGYDARFACTCQEAVEVAAAFAPDVLILDLALPHIDGYETARRLCDLSSEKPLLIALTGHQQLEGRSRAEGFDHHFLKPVQPGVLTELLRRHAAARGAVTAA
jgi:two-component system CheB/CheR fusion protein